MENKTLYVLDAPVGTGKTTAIFKWMRARPNKKYLYISPMLSEVEERVPNELESLGFVYPTLKYNPEEGTSSKSYSLYLLLKEERNIAFSHALFTEMGKHHLEEIRKAGYTLVIDEEVDFISAYRGKYKRADTITLLNNGWIEVDESSAGRVNWVHTNIEDNSQYSHFKEMCDMGQLFCAKRDRAMLVTQLPMELLSSTEENILITYMFDHSIMKAFLEMRGMTFIPLEEKYPDVILKQSEEEWKDSVRSLITLSDIPSTKRVKEMGGLTNSWYNNPANKEGIRLVAAALNGVCRKHGQENVLYTMPKQSATRTLLTDSSKRNRLCAVHRNTKVGEGYFLYSGARATNKYIHKTVAVHAYNRYPNVPIKAYLTDYGGNVDDDKFALAEMVQWLWRTAIRVGKPVEFYILSKRMEDLFKGWLY